MKANIIIGQSGGPTSVINSTLCGIIQSALKSEKFGRILGMQYGIEGFMNDEIIDLGMESQEVIEGLRNTPSSALGSCRHKIKDEDFPKILSQLKKYDIRYFFLIGGNDTMDTIHRVEEYCKKTGYELIGIGLPKTVDNDLFGTDHTPGYPSAARYVALSVQQAGRLACDMKRVDKFVIHQTVGRDSGWLAASSALAKKDESAAPHLIYIPERKINKEKMVLDVRNCIDKYGWVSIVCGEGIAFDDGTLVSASMTKDKFSNIEFGAMGGTAAAFNLHKLISNETGFRGEFQITESLPMCAIDRASRLDLDEAYECGKRAVGLAEKEITGVMVSIKRLGSAPYLCEYVTIPLKEVAVKTKPMPDQYINKEGNFITEGFIEYLAPLVGELSNYSILKKIKA
jgi:ATP-dependent phosphofructokinase / diphosphate-dependent phosphofructokinase